MVVLGVAGSLGEAYSGTLGIAGTESQDGADVLEERFGGVGAGPGGTIVFRAEQGVDDPAVRSAMSELFARARALGGTPTVISPYEPGGELRVAQQGEEAGLVAYANVSLAPGASATESKAMGAAIEDLIGGLELRSTDGLEVEVGDIWFAQVNPPESEAIGLAFAVFVLIVVLGSVVAPGWLDRILPNLNVEGTLELSETPDNA